MLRGKTNICLPLSGLISGIALVFLSSVPALAATCGNFNSTISYLKDLGRFEAPTRIAVGPNGRTFVADYIGGTVTVFDIKGDIAKVIPVESPMALAVSSTGEIYVATGGSVLVLNPDGSFSGKKIGAGALSSTSDIVVAEDGRVFVLDQVQNRVKVFDVVGSQIAEFGYGTLDSPKGLAIDEPRGRVIVTDQRNYKVRVYGLADYSLQYSFGQAQSDGNVTAGMFNFLQGVAVDAEGRIYVLDAGPDRLQIFDSCYTYIGTIGSHGTVPGTLNLPVDVAVDNYGRIFISSLRDGRVSVFFAGDIKNPVALNPLNNSAVLASTPSLTVKNGSINANTSPLTYEFEVSADNSFVNMVTSNYSIAGGETSSAWQTTALADNFAYYWRARATDGVTYTAWTAPFSFRVNAVKFSQRGEEVVSENSLGSDTRPVLAADEKNGKVWMAWEGDSEGISNIYVRFFDTVKEQWGAVVKLTTDAASHIKPAIAIDKNGNVFVSWEEAGGIVVTTYESGSAGWSLPVLVSSGVTNAGNASFAYGQSTGQLAMVWDGSVNDEKAVFFSRYDAVQKLWGVSERVSIYSGVADTEPSAVFDNAGRVWVSWKRTDLSGNNDIVVRNFDSNSGWSTEVGLAATPSDENSGRLMSTANGDVWLVYVTGGKIGAVKYDTLTSTWGTEAIISDGTAQANPSVASDHSGKIWVAWESSISGNPDVYAKTYDGTWSDALPMVSNPGSDTRPGLTVYMNHIWMAWESNRNGNLDVFAKSFYVDDLPSAPLLLSPLSGEVLKTLNPALTVAKAEDPDTLELSYLFEIDTVNTFNSSGVVRSSMVPGGGPEITWFPSTLNGNKVYYWRARASDGEGFGPWSQSGSFSIVTENLPPVIESYTPVESTLPVSSMSFSVTASDPNGDSLSYQWALNGKTVSGETSYLFIPKSGIDRYNLVITVSDGVNKVSHEWSIIAIWNGTLSVSSNVAGAKVYIDGNFGFPGRYLGTTPLSVQGIPVGVHSVVFRKEGYEPSYQQLHIDQNSGDLNLSVTLSKATRISPAVVTPLVTSDGSSIKVSGRAVPFVIDWNNDGFKDLIVGASDGRVYLYMSELQSDGSRPMVSKGSLTTTDGAELTVGYNAVPFVVDWNNDGRKDVIIGGGDGLIRFYLNSGTEVEPVLSSPVFIADGAGNIKVNGDAYPAVVDYDQDGRKDLVVGNAGGPVSLYVNAGTDDSPVFTGSAGISVDGTDLMSSDGSRPFFVDWNHDGKDDLAVGGSSVRLCFNVGTEGTPIFLTSSSLGDWIREKKKDRRNRDFVQYLGLAQYSLTIKGVSTFVVNWDDTKGEDLVVGNDAGEVRLYH